MKCDSAVSFDTMRRIHVGLEVGDRDRSIEFYRTLLGAEPTKVRPGYARFELADPPVNLSLIEKAGRPRVVLPESLHCGIQVKSTEDVHRAAARLLEQGLAVRTEEEAGCCYAVQTKVWVTDPDGYPWEVFVVLVDEAEHKAGAGAACCPDVDPGCCETTAGACCSPDAVSS